MAIFAWGAGHMLLFDETMRQVMTAMGVEVMHNSALQMFTKGIVAGWLIATMVWLLPSGKHSQWQPTSVWEHKLRSVAAL